MSEPSGWDNRYASAESVWSGRPNEPLVTEVTGLPPGRALELGAGEGADAVWLAEQGWAVTVTDFSRVGLERARQASATRGLEAAMDFRILDARTLTAEELLSARRVDAVGSDDHEPRGSSDGLWDLVSSFYMHLPLATMHRLIRELLQVIAPGGTLIIVGHHPDDIEAGVRRPSPELLLTAESLAEAIPVTGWDIDASARPRQASDHDGNPVTVHDAVLVAVRRS